MPQIQPPLFTDTAPSKFKIQIPRLYVAHGRDVLRAAKDCGWKIGTRYSNLRDARCLGGPNFIDIDWKNYSFERHIEAVKNYRPELTVARDWVEDGLLNNILDEAYQLSEYCDQVIIVPKDYKSATSMERRVPAEFIFGYSVPTGYGSTKIPTSCFIRGVHLLGGRAHQQLNLRGILNVLSLDQNSFTIDARFGKYFYDSGYRKIEGSDYFGIIRASLGNIKRAWEGLPSVVIEASLCPRPAPR